MSKFLYISGSKGSGKSLIRGMLDSHHQLYVSPFHERIFEAFFGDVDDVLKTKDIQKIREMLANKGHYFSIESHSRYKLQPLNVASDIHKNFKADFDFYSFERTWVKNFYKRKTNWTPKIVCEEIYKSFFKNL